MNLTADNGNRLLMGLAERADLIVDFTNVPLGSHVWPTSVRTSRSGADSRAWTSIRRTRIDRQILEFRVVPAVERSTTPPHSWCCRPSRRCLRSRTRPLALIELESNAHDGPSEAVLGNVEAGPRSTGTGPTTVTENPSLGDTEVWEFYNVTADAHPMHVHEVAFEVVNRQAIEFSEEGHGDIHPVGEPQGAEPWESGFKDTVIGYPGEVTRLKLRFDNEGQFVWHCHIVEHEDNEMMRPYRIGPVQPGQPTS